MLLNDYPIRHGGITAVEHPRLGVTTWGQSSIRYMRFLRPVCVERLELGRNASGRWIPGVPTHPAHLVVSMFDPQTACWNRVQEVSLPLDKRIEGQAIAEDDRIPHPVQVDKGPKQGIDAIYENILAEPPYVIELDHIQTDHLRVECDREHPTCPNHGECDGGPFNVPFGILQPLQALGSSTQQVQTLPYHPILRRGTIQPKAPQGMVVTDHPTMLLYSSEHLSVGFSLRRPMLMHLGWDALGQGWAKRNRLLVSRTRERDLAQIGGVSGPMLRTLTGDYSSQQWTGEVSVIDNRVCYRSLRVDMGVEMDVTFTVEPQRLLLDITQRCAADIPAIEAEAWRFAWDLLAGPTATVGVPTMQPGRNGRVDLPVLWAANDVGCLQVNLLASQGCLPRIQAESYQPYRCTTSGIVLASQSGDNQCMTLPAGQCQASLEMAVTNLQPESNGASDAVSPGCARQWATTFACFRPEHRGFSNHAAGVNCHVWQGVITDLVVLTKPPVQGPNPIDLARYTIERALLDGGGYGYHRNLYMDADPQLVSAAGRIHQRSPNLKWLKRIQPGLLEAVERMLRPIGDEGLVICPDLSGNSGSFRWSSNLVDVVGFGHMDAYVNAWSYRALRNAAALLGELNQRQWASQCKDCADGIRAVYADQLLNPQTGWVAGWRSRDGQLHDYAFTWINGAACAFGLLEPTVARKSMQGLENLRTKLGMQDARLGIALNLLPIAPADHVLPQIRGVSQPTFETYTDGGLNSYAAMYYLRALSILGLKTEATKLADQLDQGFLAGVFSGGVGSGVELRSWEGLPTGYEGTLVGNFPVLYSVAIAHGALTPPEPEWWPAS